MEHGRRLRESLAVLEATEAYAESVEAVVLRELAGGRPSQTAKEAGSIAKKLAASMARVPYDYTCLHQQASRSS